MFPYCEIDVIDDSKYGMIDSNDESFNFHVKVPLISKIFFHLIFDNI